ncbi:putative gastrointestinal growth factor xP1 [Pelobates fuscus]|uniref:putative gastrointestinal growth factor xP1 n=1 Tax=Pelobates fuscus TaxID=191477 RepID=UPI002FE46A18
MDSRLFCVLAIMLIAGHSVVALTGTQCEVSASARVNCGFPGITAAECDNKGCCFDSAIQGAPWCFHAQTKDECLL